MARKVITVCDICESDKDVRQWEIRSDGERAKAELCGTHSAPLKRLLNPPAEGTTEGTTEAPTARSRGRGRPSRYVVTDDTTTTA